MKEYILVRIDNYDRNECICGYNAQSGNLIAKGRYSDVMNMIPKAWPGAKLIRKYRVYYEVEDLEDWMIMDNFYDWMPEDLYEVE